MDEPKYNMRKELIDHFKIYFVWVLSNVLEAFFLVIWGFSIYAFNHFISQFPLTGLDQILFTIVQVILAIVGILPILFWVAKNTILLFLKTRREIRQALHDDAMDVASKRNASSATAMLQPSTAVQPNTARLVMNTQNSIDPTNVDNNDLKSSNSGTSP